MTLQTPATCKFGDFTVPALPRPDFGRLSQYFHLQKPYCHFPNRLFLHALSLLNSCDGLCHLTCDRSQAHWSVVPRTLSRAQEWQDTHKEPLKPIATKKYDIDCQKVLIPQPEQTDIPLHSTRPKH